MSRTRDVIVVGAGGHAKVLVALLQRLGTTIAGLVESDPNRHGQTVLGRPILGDDTVVLALGPERVELVNGIGAVGPADLRAAVHERFSRLGFTFRTVVDPWALVAADVVLESGCQVMAGAILQPGCRIGQGAIVNTRAALDHDCLIGPFAHVAPGAVLSGGVRVGARALVGVGACVRQGIAIGDGTVVGAGAAVVCDLPAGVTAMGVPARIQGGKVK